MEDEKKTLTLLELVNFDRLQMNAVSAKHIGDVEKILKGVAISSCNKTGLSGTFSYIGDDVVNLGDKETYNIALSGYMDFDVFPQEGQYLRIKMSDKKNPPKLMGTYEEKIYKITFG